MLTRRHTGEKTHFCEICGKGFIRGHDVKVHSLTHTGERPFQCLQCTRSQLTTHLSRVHKTSPGTRRINEEKPKASVGEKDKKERKEKKENSSNALDRGLAPVAYEELDVKCELDNVETKPSVDLNSLNINCESVNSKTKKYKQMQSKKVLPKNCSPLTKGQSKVQ